MKSGDSKKNKTIKTSLSGTLNQQDFACHHIDQSCKGKWGILHSFNSPYPLDCLGAVILPMVPMIACPVCKAAYMLPGFLEFVEKSIATTLIVSDRILLSNEIRFLRVTFDLTQQEVVDAIDAESVSYYSKCETGKPGIALASDKQVRLKVFYATKLGINRAEDYHRINLTSTRRESQDDESPINSKLQIIIKKGNDDLTKMENRFKQKYHLSELPIAKRA
jgi:hypothetical protein